MFMCYIDSALAGNQISELIISGDGDDQKQKGLGNILYFSFLFFSLVPVLVIKRFINITLLLLIGVVVAQEFCLK